MAVKLRSLRGLIRWMARASTSLPVPLSPVMSTVVLWRATRLASSSTSRMARLSHTTRSLAAPAPRLVRSTSTSRRSFSRSSALRSVIVTSSGRNGLWR